MTTIVETLAPSEGAEGNNLRKAPAPRFLIDFLLSLARQEVEKRQSFLEFVEHPRCEQYGCSQL